MMYIVQVKLYNSHYSYNLKDIVPLFKTLHTIANMPFQMRKRLRLQNQSTYRLVSRTQ